MTKVEECLEAAVASGEATVCGPVLPNLGAIFARHLAKIIMLSLIPATPIVDYGVPCDTAHRAGRLVLTPRHGRQGRGHHPILQSGSPRDPIRPGLSGYGLPGTPCPMTATISWCAIGNSGQADPFYSIFGK